jgi:hypothetical protein
VSNERQRAHAVIQSATLIEEGIPGICDRKAREKYDVIKITKK